MGHEFECDRKGRQWMECRRNSEIKRWLSGFLALVCFCMSFLTSIHTGSITSYAATFKGTNIWTGGSEILNGRSRNYLYRWTDGWQMTFCIAPGNHMGSTVTAGAVRTNIEDADIPYIDSREDYEKLAMICSWYDANGSIYADNATYAAAQTAVWAVVGDGWESGDSMAQLVDKHVKGTYDRWKTLKNYVESNEGGEGLPAWCSLSSISGKTQVMQLNEGVWTVELDMSPDPGLAALNWTFEGDGSGWGKSVSGDKLIFTYAGDNLQEMTVSAVLPDSMKSMAKNTTSLNLYIPEGDPDKIQSMVSAGPYEGKLYVRLAFTAAESGQPEEPEVKRYRHTETFISHYNLDLRKYCGETGKTLESAIFQIQESFDASQIDGLLEKSCMSPVPASWTGFKVCSEAVTDQEGYLFHTDEKQYEYSKTYCDGHPEPEYMEVPEPSGDPADGTDNSDEIAAIEEANEAMRTSWEALVQACQEETDFHSEEPGEGLEMMLADRDETYQQFIRLQYDYTVEEIQARYGYVRHGLHPEDEKIPVIRMESSEAGAGGEVLSDSKNSVAEAKVSRHRTEYHTATPSVATGANAVFQFSKEDYFYIMEHSMPLLLDEYEEDLEVSASLPEPEDDDVEWIEPSGTPDEIGYTFAIYDHRTEGELHINKKDLELPQKETQGDATLAGAVYGLYAAEDIVHPDGKTGTVYRKDELTAIATTDEEGNASFLAYTEDSETSENVSDKVETWVGHPLILGHYYIKEIARSEGYELSVRGIDRDISNLHTRESAVTVKGRADVVTAMTHPIDMHDGSWLEFEVVYEDTEDGFWLNVSGFPEESSFYRSGMEETTQMQQVVTGTQLVPTGEYEKAEEGEFRLDEDGNYMPVLDAEGNQVWDTENPVSRTYYVRRRLNYYPDGVAVPQIDPGKYSDSNEVDLEYVKAEANDMLEQVGYQLLDSDNGDDSQWTILELAGTANRELIGEILDWFADHSFWDSGAVYKVWEEDGQYRAAIYHDYRRLSGNCFYEELSNTLYVRIPVEINGMGERHMFVTYSPSEFVLTGSYGVIAEVKQVSGPVDFLSDLEEQLETVYQPLYQTYHEGDYRLDGDGQRIPVYETQFIYGEKAETTSDYALEKLVSIYDGEKGCHWVRVENTVDWNTVDEPVTETFRAVAEAAGDTYGELFYSDFLTDHQGTGASALVKAETESDSYIQFVPLMYPGQISAFQDGTGIPGCGTVKSPVVVEQRIIKQKIKVMKDTQEASKEQGMSGEQGTLGEQGTSGEQGARDESDGRKPLGNFRFKSYLKSNLERLYRDTDGQVTWTDKTGNPIDIESFLEQNTALVPAIWTREGQRILETVNLVMADGDGERTVKAYNYEKFFDAIGVANRDKWDDAAPSYTSYRPVGNHWNRTEETLENTRISDAVRQFAIDWYLEDQVDQLTEGTDEIWSEEIIRYGDELYDKALYQAIEQAQNYLKPFFSYDFDTIYGIAWDCASKGGSDGDDTTVSTDEMADDFSFGLSEYMPYGMYIIVEQQPQYAYLHDFSNKHYQIDAPKEVAVPSVYADYQAFMESPGEMSSFYLYDADMSMEMMEQRYLIRFGEEKQTVEAHNRNGDFQIQPYGDAWSEKAGIADDVCVQGGTATDRNPSGMQYSDRIRTMTGVQTVYDGLYAPVLVPWSMEKPENEESDLYPEISGESSYKGFAGVWFRNLYYQVKLRLEKLDGETHENILHDEARFCIYEAERDTAEDGEGQVKFYEEDTMISGSKEFLESMGADQITPMARGVWNLLGPGVRYTGVVPAGTPVCREETRITMADQAGNEVGEFQVFSTIWDGLLQGNQNTGYLETPEPLVAGVYVLAETMAPAGYVRTKPVAVEIYSDKVTYYKEGNQDKQVLSAVYDWKTARGDEEDQRPKNQADQAVVYVENSPTKLIVEKVKEASADTANTTDDKTVTWILNGRIDGSWSQIGEDPSYEYAYVNGIYQGYGWKKGTLEYLMALKQAGEDVEIVYHGNLFAGYGLITRKLETADDKNLYVPGAVMTLYEAIELTPSGDKEDCAYEGLVVQRSWNQTVTRMYTEDNRDILYYDLSGLDVFRQENVEGRQIVYGYGKNHEKRDISQLEESRRNQQPTDQEYSVYAFKNGVPYLELVGGDFTEISYSSVDCRFYGDFSRLLRDVNGNYTFSDGMVIYHLNQDGIRDSLVDPETGMAYVLEETKGPSGDRTEKIYVWPVQVVKDPYGNVISRDKIATYRTATIGENNEIYINEEYPESGYITGTWQGAAENAEESHTASTVKKNKDNQNLHGEVLLNENPGMQEKTVNPVLNEYGQPEYYQKDQWTYHVDTPLYDRDGELVRHKTSDLLEYYNQNAYTISSEEELEVSENSIFHRQGEGYILENTWTTGDQTPNDPFHDQVSDGQPDVLKRVPVGAYIMEEIQAPAGYTKGFPVAVSVKETAEPQHAQMVDYTTKVMIGKVDGTDQYTYQIMDMQSGDTAESREILGTITEGKGSFGFGQLEGAGLSLSGEGGAFHKSWITKELPFYAEGLSQGSYVLQEEKAPEGFVTAEPLEIQVEDTREVQTFLMYNDHTRLEIEKYYQDGKNRVLVNDAGFTLYQALTNEEGQIIWTDGQPQYEKDKPVDSWKSCDGESYRGFVTAFEEMYRDYGTEGSTVAWEYKGANHRADQISCTVIDASVEGGTGSHFPTTAQLIYQTEDGTEIRVTIYQQKDNRQGADFTFEYQLDYHRLRDVGNYTVSYLTLDGMRRFDYLPVGAAYVLVETEVPQGFAKAQSLAIVIEDTVDVQRYSVLNEESVLRISKKWRSRDGECSKGELAGASLALYKADSQGQLVQDQAHLAAQWTSGSDGVYTELEKINHQIPDGYEPGDLKPHTLRQFPEGIYYLMELQAPDYYGAIEPLKIEYHYQDEIQTIQAVNNVVSGQLEIEKTDEDGAPLSGAVFRLSAYSQSDMEKPIFSRTYSEHGGQLVITGLEVGEILEDGSVRPYVYKLEEVVAPEGYVVDDKAHTFSFAPDQEGTSYQIGDSAKEQCSIVNEKTQIQIQKKILGNFSDDGEELWAEGAELAIYQVCGRGEEGDYCYDENSPIVVWKTSSQEPSKTVEGLIAGQTYVLMEQAVPDGLRRMNPIVFTISMDGRGISQMDSDISMITVRSVKPGENGNNSNQTVIEGLTVKARQGVAVEVCVVNEKGQEVACWTADGNGHKVAQRDHEDRYKEGDNQLTEGELCSITETTIYSDGTREVTGKEIRRVYFDETTDGFFVDDRMIQMIGLQLAAEDGKERIEYAVTDVSSKWEIDSADLKLETGKNYILTETTTYSDGSQIKSGQIQFMINEYGVLDLITGFDKEHQVMISKTDITGEREVPGAVIQILDEKNQVLEEWTSGEAEHWVEAVLEPGETYILHEEYAPDGYGYASDIRFTVSEDGIVEKVVMSDRMTHVRIRKTDITGQEEVPGAALQIRDSEGHTIEEWISGMEPHDIVGSLVAGEEYWLHEEHAPEGYAYAADVSFKVSMDGRIDVVTMKDEKLPERSPERDSEEEDDMEESKPDIPQLPETQEIVEQPIIPSQPGPLKRVGRITAVYERSISAKGKDSFGGLFLAELPKLGDEGCGGMMAILTGLSMAFFILIRLLAANEKTAQRKDPDGVRQERTEKKVKAAKKNRWWFLGVMFLVLLFPIESRAESVVRNGEAEIIITWPSYTTDSEEVVLPPESYEYEGKTYYQKSSQLVVVDTEEKEQWVQDTIVYEQVEQADTLPETAVLEVVDEETGQTVEVSVPVLKKSVDHWRWVHGFEFEITVQQYDAGQFYLGDEIVTEGQGRPFEGLERELLELIGVNPDYYSIESTEWLGPAWSGEDGLVYRQARAVGKKYVADCSVTYGGQVVIPPVSGTAWQACYALGEANETGREITGNEVEDQKKGDADNDFWNRYKQEIISISVGLLFLLILLILTIFLRKRRKSKCKKRTKNQDNYIKSKQKYEH